MILHSKNLFVVLISLCVVMFWFVVILQINFCELANSLKSLLFVRMISQTEMVVDGRV